MVASAKSQEAFAAKEVASLKAEIETFQKRLAFKRSGFPEGIDYGSTSNLTVLEINIVLTLREYAETQTLFCSVVWFVFVRISASSRMLTLFCADAAQEPLSDDERIRMEVRVDQRECGAFMYVPFHAGTVGVRWLCALDATTWELHEQDKHASTEHR